ncbi:MAG: LCP family protein, partial [Frankia sp.]|nr:LCP family protein [Frankia sp.]
MATVSGRKGHLVRPRRAAPPVSRATLSRSALPPQLSPRGPRRRSPLGRISLATCSLLSVLVLALSVGGWLLYREFDSKIDRTDLDIEGERPVEVPGDLNILLLGDDSREGTGGEFGEVEGVRSDTTIIAHFDSDGTATLLSFPRDTLVTVTPRVPGTPGDGRDKLANVLTYAGVEGLITTLEAMTALRIDHFVSINLAGFREMTDAVGGVTVCVTRLPDGSTRNLNDEWSQWHGQLGENHLNGDQALAFVRTRHALGDERLRILRQQQFLSKLLDKATSTGVLTNPSRLTALLGAVGQSLTMDKGLNQEKLLELAKRVSQLGGGKLQFITVPTHVPLRSEGASDDKGSIGSHGNVLFINQDEFQQILAPMRPAPEEDPALADAPDVPPAQVTIAAVVNAAGRDGLAGETVSELRALGFAGPMETRTGDAEQAVTEVRYPAGQEGAAKALATRIPGAQAVADPKLTGTSLTLVLGTSFTGVPGAAGGTAPADPAAGAATASPAARGVTGTGATAGAPPGPGATAPPPPPPAPG